MTNCIKHVHSTTSSTHLQCGTSDKPTHTRALGDGPYVDIDELDASKSPLESQIQVPGTFSLFDIQLLV